MATQARPQRKSNSYGVANELSCIFKIKPGREEYIRRACKAGQEDPDRLAALKRVGTLTESRFVIFENGTRLAFFTVFEGDWDRYIEDFMSSAVMPVLDSIFRDNVEGWFTKPLAEVTVDEAKAGIDACQVTAASFIWMHPDHTLKEIWKALRVNQAFQKVLDDPTAQKALEHPALKPLLAEATD